MLNLSAFFSEKGYTKENGNGECVDETTTQPLGRQLVFNATRKSGVVLFATLFQNKKL